MHLDVISSHLFVPRKSLGTSCYASRETTWEVIWMFLLRVWDYPGVDTSHSDFPGTSLECIGVAGDITPIYKIRPFRALPPNA